MRPSENTRPPSKRAIPGGSSPPAVTEVEKTAPNEMNAPARTDRTPSRTTGVATLANAYFLGSAPDVGWE
jgi:hypothetical protein